MGLGARITAALMIITILISALPIVSVNVFRSSANDSIGDLFVQDDLYGGPSTDPDLKALISTLGDQDSVDIIISFRDHLYRDSYSRVIGLLDPNYHAFKVLPMVRAQLPKWFVSMLMEDRSGGILSIYLNKRLDYYLRESVEIIGAPYVWNGVYSPPTCGSGNFTVAVIDTGADQTHPDLKDAIIKNVKIVGSSVIDMTGLNTDLSSGHGTHVAGIIADRGSYSDGYYRGVAPCARLISIGAGDALFIFYALQAFDWILENRFALNIRVISNSWGTTATNIDPYDPINLASYEAYRRGIVVVFAAGNSGPSIDTLNKYSVVPWVIGVAAGTKDKELTYFSSRGVPGHLFKKPTITAPGVNIYSARTSTVGITATDTNINPVNASYTYFYTALSGTSMATPHVAGVVALMLSINPMLSPDQVKEILVATADPMPGYGDFEVGAGYLNAKRAVSLAATVKGNLENWKPMWSPEKLQEWIFGRTIYTGEYLPSQRYFQGTAPPGERLLGLITSPGPKHVVNISPFYSIVPVKVIAQLTWSIQACDLDLAVYDPSGRLIAYGGRGLLEYESVEFFVNNVFGNYTFEVVVWLCPAPTPYTLNVTILYGDPKLVRIIPPKTVQQYPGFDIYVTTPRIFKVYDGVGIASTYFKQGDSAFITFRAFYINGSPATGLTLILNILHESGGYSRQLPARDVGGGSYRADLYFDPAWISGKYFIAISGSYKMVADKSTFYLNWLEIFIRPHQRVSSPGSYITLYLRSVTLNDIGINRVFFEPVIATYKIYINNTLADFTIDTILNDWIVIQLRLPQTGGLYIVNIIGGYSEPITNIPWSGNKSTWVFLRT